MREQKGDRKPTVRFQVNKAEILEKGIPNFPMQIVESFVLGNTMLSFIKQLETRSKEGTPLYERLFMILGELQRLETVKIYATYQIDKLRHQPNAITPELTKSIEKTKALYFGGFFPDPTTDLAMSSAYLVANAKAMKNEEFYSCLLKALLDVIKEMPQPILTFVFPKQFENCEKAEISKALRQFASGGHIEIMRACLDAGADPLAGGPKSGKNAIDRAREGGHDEIVSLLEAHVRDHPQPSEEPEEVESVPVEALAALSVTNTQTTVQSRAKDATSKSEEYGPNFPTQIIKEFFISEDGMHSFFKELEAKPLCERLSMIIKEQKRLEKIKAHVISQLTQFEPRPNAIPEVLMEGIKEARELSKEMDISGGTMNDSDQVFYIRTLNTLVLIIEETWEEPLLKSLRAAQPRANDATSNAAAENAFGM